MKPSLHRRREIDDEIRHHVEECVDLLVARGWDPEAARQEAERRFGDVRAVREELAKVGREGLMRRGLRRVRGFGAHIRYTLRGLRANPGFTASVLLTLSLGTGVATSVFSVVDAGLLRPFAYRDAERWVEVFTRTEQRTSQGQSVERFEAWREAGSGLVDGWVGFYRLSGVHGRRGPDLPTGTAVDLVGVTPGTTSLLGIPLLRGRGFTADDARPGAPPVALLGRRYWEGLGGDPGILGTTLELDSGPVTVVGILGGQVKFPYFGPPPDIWLPVGEDFRLAGREIEGLQGVWARLRPGVGLDEARDRAATLAGGLQEARPTESGWAVALRPLGSFTMGAEARQALWILAATVGLILIIAVVNGVNLLLARATGRAREFAVRMAAGASRRQLAGQLLAEGLILGLLGGGAAVLLATAAVETLGDALPSSVAFWSPHPVTVELRTLGFAFSVALLSGTLLGMVPWVELARTRSALSRSGGSDDPPGLRRTRRALVVGQVAVSTVLLFGAGLFVRSLTTLLRVDPGYDHPRLVVGDLSLLDGRYTEATRADFLRRLDQRLEAHPAVAAASWGSGGGLLVGDGLETSSGTVEGVETQFYPTEAVADDYLATLGIELEAGRAFRPSDRGRSDLAIIDVDLARALGGPARALGERFRVGEDGRWRTVVGVVGDVRLEGRDQRDAPYQVFLPEGGWQAGSYVRLWVRTPGDPSAVIPLVRRAVGELDPMVPVHELRPAAAQLAEQESQARFLVGLMSILGVVAVILAAAGLYGVLAYAVGRRRRELGVRMALGARGRTLLVAVMGEGMLLAALGVGLGLTGALALTRWSERLLYGVGPRDPLTAAAVVVLLLGVAAAASLLPAQRATRVNPAEALRAE